MKETMTKLAVNFGPGEAFEVFVERGQLGNTCAVLAGRWAEVTVGSPCAAQPDPEALCEKINAEADRRRGVGLADLMAKQPAPEAVCEEHEAFKRAKGEVCAKSGRRYRLSGDGWVVTFTQFNLVEVNGKLNDDQLANEIGNLAGKHGGADAIRECVRIALHFLKDRFVMVPESHASVGCPISHNGLSVFSDKVECWDEIWNWHVDARIETFVNALHAERLLHAKRLQFALFRLIRICGQERDKSVTGTAVEAPPAIVDGIDTIHGVVIKSAEPKLRTAHLRVFHDDWSVTYWDDGKVEFVGEPCWGRFGNNLDVAMERKEITSDQVRKAILFALVECSKLGLLDIGVTQPARYAIYYGGYMRVYRHPDNVWILEDAYDLMARESAKIQQDKVVEVLTIVTRMLGGAK